MEIERHRYDAIEASWDTFERVVDQLEEMGWSQTGTGYQKGLKRGDSFLPWPANDGLARAARLALAEGLVPPEPEKRYHFVRGYRGGAEEVLTEEAKIYDIASAYAPFHKEYKKFMEAKESA